MKYSKFFAIGFLLLAAALSLHIYAESCSASAYNCSVSCSISSPPDGSVNCASYNGMAYCVAYDCYGNIVSNKSKTCPPQCTTQNGVTLCDG